MKKIHQLPECQQQEQEDIENIYQWILMGSIFLIFLITALFVYFIF